MSNNILELKIGDFSEINRIEALQAGRPFYKNIADQEPYQSLFTKELPNGSIFKVKLKTYEDETGKLCVSEEILEQLRDSN